MAGIVQSTIRKMVVDKKVKQIEIPGTTLDTSRFIADLTALGASTNPLINDQFNALPTIVKNEASTVLISDGYNIGNMYAMNGDTKSIEGFTFTRNSSATRIDSGGVTQLVPANSPRVDFDLDTGDRLGYLFEKASTNLVLYSGMGNYGTFQAVATDFRSKCTATTIAGRSCFKYDVTGNSYLPLAPITSTPNITHTFSFYVYCTTATSAPITNASDTDNSGFAGDVPFSISANKWVRISRSFTSRTATSMWPVINFSNTNLQVYIADIQLEVGSLATSYIPTTNASATRLSDSAVSKRDLTEGFKNVTYYIQGDFVNTVSSSSIIFKGSTNILYTESPDKIAVYAKSKYGGLSKSASDFTKPIKLAVRMGINSLLKIASKTNLSGELDSQVDLSTITSNIGIGHTSSVRFHLKAFAIIPRGLTDAELTLITT